MKYQLITLLFIVMSTSALQAAKPRVTMSSKFNEQTKSYDLIAESDIQGAIILQLRFTKSINVRCKDGTNPFLKTIRYGTNMVTSVSKRDPNYSVDFAYSFSWTYGCLNKDVEPDYPYSIPLADQKTTVINEMDYIGSKYGGKPKPEGWYAIAFETTVGDTIFASRRGIVNFVGYQKDKLEKTGLSFSSKQNRLTIQHKDCSQANYSLFKDDGILVEEGQQVEVGQPLGIIGGENYTNGSHLRFNVSYYNNAPKAFDSTNRDQLNYRSFVHTKFHTSKGVTHVIPNTKITTEIDLELVKKEMTKRQVKRWLKSQ